MTRALFHGAVTRAIEYRRLKGFQSLKTNWWPVAVRTSPCKQPVEAPLQGDERKGPIMKSKTLLFVFATLLGVCAFAQEAKVTPLFSRDLTDFPGKEGLLILVEYPPGSSDPVHRHNAYAFVYVLEGSVVMQVKGGKQVTLTPGQTFFEGPHDVHVVGRNASSTQPAKFLAFLVKDKGAPALVPAK